MNQDSVVDFLAFRRMITPILIQIVYWIATVGVIIAGLIGLIVGDDAAGRLFGLATLIVGPLMVRIYAEIFLVIFRMNETLTDIKNNTQQR